MCCPFEDEKQSATNDKDKPPRDPNAPPPMTRAQLLANPSFKSVAAQTLEIQRVGTVPPRNPGPLLGGNTYHPHHPPLHNDDKSASTRLLTVGDSVHQYYPIRFVRSPAVDMDCTMHSTPSQYSLYIYSIHTIPSQYTLNILSIYYAYNTLSILDTLSV